LAPIHPPSGRLFGLSLSLFAVLVLAIFLHGIRQNHIIFLMLLLITNLLAAFTIPFHFLLYFLLFCHIYELSNCINQKGAICTDQDTVVELLHLVVLRYW
jgi:hypothetical protein